MIFNVFHRLILMFKIQPSQTTQNIQYYYNYDILWTYLEGFFRKSLKSNVMEYYWWIKKKKLLENHCIYVYILYRNSDNKHILNFFVYCTRCWRVVYTIFLSNIIVLPIRIQRSIVLLDNTVTNNYHVTISFDFVKFYKIQIFPKRIIIKGIKKDLKI